MIYRQIKRLDSMMNTWVMIIVLSSGIDDGSSGRAVAIHSVPFAAQEACTAAILKLPSIISEHGSATCVKTGSFWSGD